ncbi:hypothetical protein SXIM_08610 [Streptomyces xiamenensis]|uniref:Uncharacterized protein n=2 Tax=Streptomyces xiamenensis TaxID=408015 RepID=A0A0F7FQ74_9ACTN|nr:hypothetical protein SXIM_08610 [Streptomyces xiamenensis]
MNMRARRAAAACAAAVALTFTAACDDSDAALPLPTQSQPPGDDDASDDEAGEEETQEPPAPDTRGQDDLDLGATHTWEHSGLAVTVDRIETLDPAGIEEWERPEEGLTPFRVHVTVANTGDAPADLDSLALSVAGATSGGEVQFGMYEGDQRLTGRLAPGVSTEKSQSWAFDTGAHGADILITASYWGDDEDLWADDPQWIGSIR